jgi:hypothetical protein
MNNNSVDGVTVLMCVAAFLEKLPQISLPVTVFTP